MLPPNIIPDKIAVYLRTSTRTQKEKETIESQYHYAQLWLSRRGIDIKQCRVYKDDGVSSSLLISEKKRNAGKELLDDCMSGFVKVVCFFATDRLVREARDFHDFEKQLRELGIKMISMSENLDSSNPDDMMIMSLFAIFAERERARIVERSQAGKDRVASEGGWTGGPIPYGYRLEGRKLVAKEPQASVVRLIFKLYIKLKSTIKVKNELYNRKINSVCGNEKWDDSTIAKILRSSMYKGLKKYNQNSKRETVEGKCEALVSEADWDRAQRLLDMNTKHQRSYKAKEPYLLSGLVYCGKCGAPYYGSTENLKKKNKRRKQYRRYHHGNTKQIPCPLPNRPMIRAHRVDNQVWDSILSWVKNPGDIIEQLQEELAEEGTGPIKAALERLKADLIKVQKKKNRIIGLLIDGILQDDEGARRLESIRESIKLIESQIEEKEQILTSTEKAQQYIYDTEKLLETLHQSASCADLATKREIVLTMIDRVDIFYDTKGRKKGQGILTVKIHLCF